MKQKIVTLAILWVTMGYGVWFLGSSVWISLIMIGVALGVTIHLIRVKTYRPNISVAELDPLEEPAP